MAELQNRFTEVLETVLQGVATLEVEVCPAWLVRPGRAEIGRNWLLVSDVYLSLTGLELPEVMPLRERRRLDILLTYRNGARRVVEIDESQHFTAPRLTTLEVYEGRFPVAFDVEIWRARCMQLTGREPKGNWGSARPPLFPDDGGRHRQRAFRDMLADLMPAERGWLPTARFMDVEVRESLKAIDPFGSVASLWHARTIAP